MRLDKFLQVSRLVKRRAVAKEICNRGRVMVNGQPTKAGKELSVGDTLSISFGDEDRIVCKVLEIPSGHVPKAKAPTLYQEIGEGK